MNMYEDYTKYLMDNSALINNIKEKAQSVYVLFEDVIQVLDYIARENRQNKKIDADLQSFFTAGYNYLTSIINEMKIMYVDYFKSDFNLFAQYSDLIVYFFYVDDLKGHLDANDQLTSDNRQKIDEIQYEIEQTLVHNKGINAGKLRIYENAVEELDQDKSYRPIYTIFALVREELHLY